MNNLIQENEKLRSRNRILVTLLIASFLFIISIIAYYSWNANRGFAPGAPPAVIDKSRCIQTKPTSGNYVRVKMMFKGADVIKMRYFIWNGIDYARRCFTSADGKTYTYDAYVPEYPGESVPFEIIVRSPSNDNEVEYGIKVFDLNDKLIQKFPAVGETAKDTIEYLKFPMTVTDTLKTHN